MSITNYGTLKTAVANELDRDDLDTTAIPEFIERAEDLIAMDKRLRIRPMEASADLTISSRTVALPSGFIGARRLYIDGNPIKRLEFLAPEDFWVRNLATQAALPKWFTIEGEDIVFGPSPDSTYTGKFLYYQRFTKLAADNDTNWILTNARGLLFYGALMESAPHIGDDPRLMLWAARYDDLVEKVYEANKRDRYTGAPLVARTDVQVDTRRQR